MSLLDWLLRPRPDQPNTVHLAKPARRLGIELISSPLAAGATWTSGAYAVSPRLARVELEIETDTDGTLAVDTSYELTTWVALTVPGRVRHGFTSLWVGLSHPYVRVRYVNGPVAQGLFAVRLYDPRARLQPIKETR